MGKQLEQSVTEIESGTRGDADTDREPKPGSVQGALPFELTSARHGFPGQSERTQLSFQKHWRDQHSSSPSPISL
jgi:hypothetical protein